MRGKESRNELYESLNDSDLKRLFAKVNKTKTCWIWIGGSQMKFRTREGVKSIKQILYPDKLIDNHVVI